MGLVVDKILGDALSHSHIKILSTLPSNPSDGDVVIKTNGATHYLRMYYEGNWRTLHSFDVILYYILQENGDYILQENGDKIII